MGVRLLGAGTMREAVVPGEGAVRPRAGGMDNDAKINQVGSIPIPLLTLLPRSRTLPQGSKTVAAPGLSTTTDKISTATRSAATADALIRGGSAPHAAAFAAPVKGPIICRPCAAALRHNSDEALTVGLGSLSLGLGMNVPYRTLMTLFLTLVLA